MRRIQAVIVAAVVLGLAAPAFADNVQWNRNKGDCEYVLKAPDRYPLGSVLECTQLWEQYRDVSSMSPDERSLFARGFSWLFIYGDQQQKAVAQGALSRIGKPKPLVFDTQRGWVDPNLAVLTDPLNDATAGNVPQPGRELRPLPRREVKAPSKKAARKAKKSNSKGFKAYKKRRYSEAAEHFRDALRADPFYVKAKYNLACNLALLGDSDGSLQALLELQSWDSGAAQGSFNKARGDRDFERLHADQRFRRLVGLVRIQLLNGADEPGLFHVGRIRNDLLARNYYIAQYGYDRYTRKRPLVYYREGYEPQARLAKDIVANPRTAVIKINWNSPFDVIIVWGDPDVASREGVSGPVVQGQPARKGDNAAGEFLGKINDAKGTIEEGGKTATEAPDLPGVGGN
jgi:tetratricopeptide (TPR) repeat protein